MTRRGRRGAKPNLQGLWRGDISHAIPLERPDDIDATELTPEEAVARREGGTLGGIWGYDREWRDTALGFARKEVSTQVAMVIDPPDGRIPPLTPEGEELAAKASVERRAYTRGPSAGPENLTPYVRCITRGLPSMMMPIGYNNGMQIVQGPGYVAITKEMIHETRIIPTEPRPEVGDNLRAVARCSAGSVGRRYPRNHDDQPQRPRVVPRVDRSHGPHRALYACRSQHAGVPVHRR